MNLYEITQEAQYLAALQFLYRLWRQRYTAPIRVVPETHA